MQQPPTVGRALSGSLIAIGFAALFYQGLQGIIGHLPAIDLSAPRLAQSISLLVRYLLVGSIGLMTFTFAAVGLGLLAYSGQLALQQRDNG